MMNKWWWLLLMTLCWAGAGLAMFGVPDDKTPEEISPAQVQRIISMSPNITEILFKLGLADKVVAVTLRSDYPPEATKKPKIGTFWQPNIEAIIAARPDLVITLGFTQHKDLARRLKRTGCPALTVNIEKVTELFQAIEKIGVATAAPQEADKLLRNIRRKLEELSTLVAAKEEVNVLWVVQKKPLRVAGTGTFVNEMIELAGGRNAIGATVHKYPPIGAEQVIAYAPDVIIEPTMALRDPAEQLQETLRYWGRFDNIPAVANKRIYVISGDTVSRLGPRLYEGTETIARCLWPELFEK